MFFFPLCYCSLGFVVWHAHMFNMACVSMESSEVCVCFLLVVCDYAIRLDATLLQELAAASLGASSCVGDLVVSDDTPK